MPDGLLDGSVLLLSLGHADITTPPNCSPPITPPFMCLEPPPSSALNLALLSKTPPVSSTSLLPVYNKRLDSHMEVSVRCHLTLP